MSYNLYVARGGQWWSALLLVGLLLGVDPIAADEPAGKTAAKWIALTEGPSLDAWRDDRRGWSVVAGVKLNPDKPRRLIAKPGDGIVLSDGDGVNLYTREDFQDVELRCEFLIPERSNAGVKLNGLYEIQIRDTHGEQKLTGDMCGGVYPRAKLGPPYSHIDEGIAPRENAAKPAGEWQSLALTFYSPRFDAAGEKIANARFEHVVLNGKEIHREVDLKHPTGAAWNMMPEVARGPLMLQGDHGPVAFREIEIRPLAP